MKVSVAMASYNGAAFIGRQVQSLADQTRRPDELVVADDGSDDGTLTALAEVLGRNGMSAKVLLNQIGTQLRPPRNFERAISQCSGDIVFCCDQDDDWDASKIAKVCAQLESRPEIACFLNNARFCDGNLNATGQDKMGLIRRNGLPKESFVMGCCAAFRKSFLEFALPIPDEITHDGWLVGLCDLLKISERSSEVLQSYRIHGSNVSAGFFINSAGQSSRPRIAISRVFSRISEFTSNQALLRELTFVSAAQNRLDSCRRQIREAYPRASLDDALRDLIRRRKNLEFRRSIRQAMPRSRLRLLWYGIRNGCYRGSSGKLNAIKDALVYLRPSARYKLWTF